VDGHVTRFVVDCGVVLHLASEGIEVRAEHERRIGVDPDGGSLADPSGSIPSSRKKILLPRAREQGKQGKEEQVVGAAVDTIAA
jgi:hypothetical protein